MKVSIVLLCFVVSICAFRINTAKEKKYDFKIELEEPVYSNVPAKYSLVKTPAPLPSGPMTDLLKEIASSMQKKEKIVTGTSANLNDYADKIFANLHDFMVHAGLDPVEMPDMHEGFNYTFIITYHGELDLTSGWLSDLSTLHRGGDVIATYSSETKYLEVTIPIAFDDLQFTYDYSAKIMGLGPKGGIEGKVNSVGVEVKIGFNAVTLEASLDEFYITNSGHITFHFNGNPLVDWLLNLLTDVITIVLKRVILLVVEGVIRGGLEAMVEAINAFIGGIINPTTAIPTTTVAALFFG